MTFSQARAAAVDAAAAVLAAASRNERAAATLMKGSGASSGNGAASIGISRQAAQEATRRVVERLDERAGAALGVLTRAGRSRLPAVTANEELPQHLAELLPGDGAAADLVRSIVIRRQGRRMYHAMSVSAKGIAALARLRARKAGALARGARRIADWREIVDTCGVQGTRGAEAIGALCGVRRWGRWAILTPGVAGRVEAALHQIGEPADAERIAGIAGCTAGNIQQQASAWPWMRRSGNNRWGLAAWGHADYRSCIEAMRGIVRASGGRIKRGTLLARVSAEYAVRPSTVQSYLKAGAFHVSDGFVEQGANGVQALRPLAEQVDGFDAGGRPFVMIEAYDERLLRGYSATNIPYEIAAHAGCKPGGRIDLDVVEPAGCGPLNCIWSTTSTSKISIGRLARACRALGVQIGDHVRLSVAGDAQTWIERVRKGAWQREQSLRAHKRQGPGRRKQGAQPA